MKKIYLVIGFFLIYTFNLKAQVVVEEVHFDNYINGLNNDLVDYFSNGNGLIQIPTNGITGGSVNCPDSISWGNDNAIYCSTYHPIINDTMEASICFKFNLLNIHASAFQRAVSLWMIPHSDYNHYLFGTINYNQRLELVTYGWTNNPGPVAALLNNHWYKYVLNAVIIGGINNQINVKSSVFDLGVTGGSFPSLVTSSSGTFNDNIFVADTSIIVSFTGASYGGAVLLDDFTFHGRKGVSSCPVSTGIEQALAGTPVISYFSADDKLTIDKKGNQFIHLRLLNVSGQIVLTCKLKEEKSIIDVSALSSGIYILQLAGINNAMSSKIAIFH